MKSLLFAACLLLGLAACEVVSAQGNPTLPAGKSSRPSFNQSQKTLPSPRLPVARSTAWSQLTDGAMRLASNTLSLLNPFDDDEEKAPQATRPPTGTQRTYSNSNRPKTSGSGSKGLLSVFSSNKNGNNTSSKGSSESVTNFLDQPRIPFR